MYSLNKERVPLLEDFNKRKNGFDFITLWYCCLKRLSVEASDLSDFLKNIFICVQKMYKILDFGVN